MGTVTTKTDLKRLLGALGDSTLRMIAVEVGCVVHHRGRASNQASAGELTDFLSAHPVAVRKAAAWLRTATKDPKHQPLILGLERLRYAGVTEAGGWTLTPVSATRVQVSKAGKPTVYCEPSTDRRVGLVVFEHAESARVTQLAHAGLSAAVMAALDKMLPAA